MQSARIKIATRLQPLGPLGRTFASRLQLLGPIGLSALFFGGCILILIKFNTVGASPGETSDESIANRAVQFNYFSAVSIQGWLAILGIGFGSISYGLNEAYMHFFDSYCSSMARRRCGLNYGRYLNSQDRAPVLYGMRGFSSFITGRYILSIITIAGSIGYKFGIVEFDRFQSKEYSPDQLVFKKQSLQLFSDGNVNPWLSDTMGIGSRRTFEYLNCSGEYDSCSDADAVPRLIIMVGMADCPTTNADNLDLGNGSRIRTWEWGMVARYKKDEGSFVMTQNHSGWTRTGSSHSTWKQQTATKLDTVVDYRIKEPNQIQIQWANGWNTSDSDSMSLAHRVTYNLAYSLLSVNRTVKDEDCFLEGADALLDSAPSNPASFPNTADLTKMLPHFDEWVDGIISNSATSKGEGMSALVRMVMTGWASITYNDKASPDLGPVLEADNPLKALNSTRDYPPLTLDTKRTSLGCYATAASLYLSLGLVSIVLVVVRLVLGPPVLTSWMGQHVYLALGGGISALKVRDELLTGHTAANDEFMRLRLPEDLLRPHDWVIGAKRDDELSLADTAVSLGDEAEQVADPVGAEDSLLQPSMAYRQQ